MLANIFGFFINFIFLFNFIVLGILGSLVPIGIYAASYFLSWKFLFFEKINSYECGFSSHEGVLSGFRLVFFSIVVIFIIFELEIFIFVIFVENNTYSLLIFVFIFIYVILSFYIEWYFGSLVWKI